MTSGRSSHPTARRARGHGLLALDTVRLLERGRVEPVHLLLPPAPIFPQSSMYPLRATRWRPAALSRGCWCPACPPARRCMSRCRTAAVRRAPRRRYCSWASLRFTPSLADTGITSPRALNEPVGSRPSSFTSSAPPSSRPFSAEHGEVHHRRRPLAERHAVLRSAHGEQLAPFPQRGRPRRERLARELAFQGFQVVPHQERLAGIGEAVQRVRFVLLAGQRALQVRDEGPGDLVVGGDTLSSSCGLHGGSWRLDRGMIEERGTRQRRSAVGESFRSADEVGADARRFGTLVGQFGRERTWSFQAAVNFEPAAFAGSAIARRGARRRADLPVRLGFASARTREPGRRAAVK